MNRPHDVVGPVPAGRDPDGYDRLRRRVLWSMPSGLYVVGTRAGYRRNLMTISWATQVAMDPKLVGIGVEAEAVTHALVETAWCVRLEPAAAVGAGRRAALRRARHRVIGRRRHRVGIMQGQPVHSATTGAPVLDIAVPRGWTARCATSWSWGAIPGSWAKSSTVVSQPSSKTLSTLASRATTPGLTTACCAWRTPA